MTNHCAFTGIEPARVKAGVALKTRQKPTQIRYTTLQVLPKNGNSEP